MQVVGRFLVQEERNLFRSGLQTVECLHETAIEFSLALRWRIRCQRIALKVREARPVVWQEANPTDWQRIADNKCSGSPWDCSPVRPWA